MFVVWSRFLAEDGAWFDLEGYRTVHLPLLRRLHAKHGLLSAEVYAGQTEDELARTRYVFVDEDSFGHALNDMKAIRLSFDRFSNACMHVTLYWDSGPEEGPPPGRSSRNDADHASSSSSQAFA